jgi:hypothetical protein
MAAKWSRRGPNPDAPADATSKDAALESKLDDELRDLD